MALAFMECAIERSLMKSWSASCVLQVYGKKCGTVCKNRLCLARGLAVEPEVLLCDEISSALDPISARRLEDRLVELKDGYSIVLVTHVLRQARHLAEYVLFMYLGEIVEHGPAEEIFCNPKEEKTRAYIAGEFY